MMYISKDMIDWAMNLSIPHLSPLYKTGLNVSNVVPSRITGIEYEGMTTDGRFVYEIFGPSTVDGDDVSFGLVYLMLITRGDKVELV